MTWAEKGGMDDDDKVKVVVCKVKDSKYCVLAVLSLSPMCERDAYNLSYCRTTYNIIFLRRLDHFF